MPGQLDARTEILAEPQREIWPLLAPARRLSFVLYGGTAIALHLGHRTSIDFDFFRSTPLDKRELATGFAFMRGVETSQESENTLVVSAAVPSGRVKVLFFGGIGIDRVNDPLETRDAVLLVASLEDLLATKLKSTLDRAEAKDYRDIAAILAAGTSLERGLGAFTRMYGKDAALVLRAIGFFKDGDLPSLSEREQDFLRAARDRVTDIPDIALKHGLVGA